MHELTCSVLGQVAHGFVKAMFSKIALFAALHGDVGSKILKTL